VTHIIIIHTIKSRVGIAQSVSRLGYRLHDEGIGFRFQVEVRDFSVLHNVQTASEAHPACYRMDTPELFLGGKMAGA
jgi:hypothetical protein